MPHVLEMYLNNIQLILLVIKLNVVQILFYTIFVKVKLIFFLCTKGTFLLEYP